MEKHAVSLSLRYLQLKMAMHCFEIFAPAAVTPTPGEVALSVLSILIDGQQHAPLAAKLIDTGEDCRIYFRSLL